MRTGERTLQQSGQDTTDDRGMYRIYGLQPGDYIVNAVPRNQNIGDLRQTLQAELEVIMQQMQQQIAAAGGDARGGGAGRGGGGGGGAAGRRRTRRSGRRTRRRSRLDGTRRRRLRRTRRSARRSAASRSRQQLQQSEQEQTVAYAPVYYPGTTLPSGASTVTLAVGDERQGVDFQLRLVATAKIEGTIVSPDGALPPGTQVGLVAIDPGGNMPNIPGAGMNQARTNAQGQFTFTGIAPGQYRLMARAAVRQAPAGGEAAATRRRPADAAAIRDEAAAAGRADRARSRRCSGRRAMSASTARTSPASRSICSPA